MNGATGTATSAARSTFATLCHPAGAACEALDRSGNIGAMED
jgi:hypothetical protein